MSMPGKGNKHHHMPHHHQQQHHPQQLHQTSHVVNVNVNQTGVTHTPQYNTVVAANQRFVPHAGSDFHVPNQSYGAQPGGQVGGGGGNVGVPGGRGPPLGGIQSIGQTQTGIPPGGPAGGQHPPPQAPTPGVQPQQPQGPTPTTTPPVHTPSPQEMGKQGHLQTVFVANQQRPTSQGYYQTGPRPQQPRGMNHRGGQGGGSTQVLSMGGAPGASAQQMQYSHPNFPGMYVQSQLSNLQPQHQQHVNYPMSMPLRPPQPHHSQGQGPFYQYPHPPAAIVTSPYFFSHQSGNFALYPVNHPFVRAASANAVNSNAQHMQGQLTNAQGSTVVPQGTLQQPAQQPQQMPTMIPVAPSEVFTGHNGGASGASSVTNRNKRRSNAIPIIHPETGESVSDQIYNEIAKGVVDNREAPQMQNCDKAVIADFAAMVAKAATESSSDSPVASSAPESPNSQIASQSLSNLKVQTNSTTNSQSNTGPPTPTQTLPGALTSPSQSLGTSSNAAQLESCPVKVDSKPLQPSIKEFQPRGGSDVKIVTTTPVVAEQLHVQLNSTATITNKDNKIPTQPPGVSVPVVMPVNEIELKNNNNTATAAVAATTTTTQTTIQSSTTSSNTSDVLIPSSTAVGANNPVPAKDQFPNLVNKNKSRSPPRGKYQNSNIPANAITIPEMPPLIKESKEHKERKANEKNANSSRGTTPTPVHNQPEHIHQKTNGETSEKSDVETLPKIETQQKTTDGKSAMQKQKNKSKQKNREISRKGAEKESGSDMDAFMNSVPTGKIVENKQTEIKETLPQRDSNKEPIKEITKDIKEKDNHESKKEKQQAVPQTHEKQHSTPEIPMENTTSVEKAPPAITFNHKDSKPTIEERSKSPIVVSNMSPIPNDVVDHSVTIKTEIDLKLIVAQKNEENSKVSALRTSIEETVTVIEKQDENAAPNQIETIPKGPQLLKYKYLDDQWSPINQKGKKTYGRDFLIQLQDDPYSRIKPTNLPDMEVVLKDSKTRQHVSRNRSPEIRSFKDHNMRGHDSLLPGFAKNSMNAKLGGLPPANKKSNSGKPRPPNKPNMVMPISLSLREEVKLREAENAWKPTRLKGSDIDIEEAKTESLAKKVRSVLNKLTPQKFDTLVSQVRALNIDTKERMERVINLVFEKAIDEPSFSVEYALMCKELAMMQVSGTDPSDSTTANFRKLIITRCQHEFQKESDNGDMRETKAKEIEECTDPEKKKELILFCEEEERRIRMKSVGNIRFIGELFKQGMLTKNIMLFCINHLLQFRDEENLECLCKLLTTIGKKLESKDELNEYFQKMQAIANDKGPGKISSRVRFMLKDVIDLRANKWVPRRDDSNPKTMDQIQKEAETERLDAQLNIPLNTPRKDDRNVDRRRNRGMAGSSEDGGWSQPVRSRASYSCDTSKLKTKPPLMDDLQLGNRNTYTMWNKNIPSVGSTKMQNKFSALENISSFDQEKRNPLQLSGSKSMGPRECGRTDYKSAYDGRSSRNGSSYQLSSSGSLTREGIPPLDSGRSQSVTMPPQSKPAPQPTSISNKPEKSFDELQKIVHMFVEEYITEGNGEDVVLEVKQHFPTSQLPAVVREIVNEVLEKSVNARESVSKLLSFLITKKSITLNDFRKGFGEILESVDDLIIDIPKILSYFADILVHLVIDETHPLAELPITLANLRSTGQSGKLVGELFSKISTICEPEFLVEKWLRSKLQISDLINGERENIDEIIKNYKLQALAEEKFSCFEQIHDHLVKLMKTSNNIVDDVVNWAKNNISDKVLEPQFIRVLMTAILEVSTVCNKQRHDFKPEIFQGLQTLIHRFVDANEKLELQCLFAAQSFANKLEFPPGLLLNIFDKLCEDNVISFESFISWETNDDAAEREGKAVALKALTCFFTSLKEAEEVSEEETSTQVR